MSETKIDSSLKIIGKSTLASVISDSLKLDEVYLSKQNVSLVLDKMWEAITDFLKNGQEVRMIGYCTFKSFKSKPRVAMNLRTNKKMVIPEKIVPKIKFSQAIKEKISQGKF